MGSVLIGGGAPIVVQSMTNTDTEDVQATARQVEALAAAGSELVRITVNTPEAAAQVPRIRERLDAIGCRVPLVGDFHYNGHKLLTQHPDCAATLAKYRITPTHVAIVYFAFFSPTASVLLKPSVTSAMRVLLLR